MVNLSLIDFFLAFSKHFYLFYQYLHYAITIFCEGDVKKSKICCLSHLVHAQVQRGVGVWELEVWAPLQNHKAVCFQGILVWKSPGKSQCYPASIQSPAIIGTPVECHLKAFSWRANGGQLVYCMGIGFLRITGTDPLSPDY